ncbi:MAG: ATP-binding protein [Pseudomonadota bacterium]|nr:ATP-binding protein [Pseudomonadota bacterium]
MPRPARPNALPSESPKGSARPFLSHTGVLAHILGELGGRNELDAQTANLLVLDPALAFQALETYAQAHAGESLNTFTHADLLGSLDACTLKSMATTAATEQLTRTRNDSQDASWRLALRCAVLSRLLAEKTDYPSPDEAWLAGLLIWLPQFAHDVADDVDHARQLSQAALDRLPLRTFLPDALRYLDEPAQRLSDAAPLVQLVVAAHRLVQLNTAAAASKTNISLLDELFLASKISPKTLGDMLNKTNTAVDAIYSENGHKQLSDIALELIRYNQLELAASAMNENSEAAILTLANLLASQESLADPVYLKLNKRTSFLESHALGSHAAAAISIRVEGSKTAAVRALFTRSAVVVLESAGNNAAVLDLQLIRQADADGLVAIPVGEGNSQGVLLVCGSATAISAVAAMPKHYTRMGELAGRTPAQSIIIEPANGYPDDHPDGLSARVRRAAHEINNPLGIIKNYLAILKIKLGDDAPVSDELRIIYEELDRIVRIVRSMTHDDVELDELSDATDLNALIQDLVKVTQPTWQSKDIHLSTLLTPGLARLTGDRDKLKQIVLNLMLNAVEATPPGGTVRIETAVLSNHRHERFIEILVADSGLGIPPDIAEQIFDPLDTSKGDGHAGLGLSIVKSLTQSMEGSVTFKTGASGTTFHISLPVT